MSKIGNNQNFGQRLNVVMTHHGGEDILNSNNLYQNSLIISAPVDVEEEDYGSYALLATDNNGNPVRLTYTLKEGNGLVAYNANRTYDVMSLEIDKDSILSSYKGYALEVGKTNIIDNYTLSVYQEPNESKTRIKVITSNLEKATDISYGIVIGDNVTISANNGVLSVNTYNLDYVDDANNISGIVRFNPDLSEGEYDWRTVEASNGVLHVITYNLDRATEEQVGVIKPDMVTTTVEQPSGTLSVLTSGLDYATDLTYGTIRPDNSTIQIVDGVIEAHAENMTCTSSSSYGVVKLDETSLGVDYAGYTYVQRYYDILAILNRYMNDYDYIISRLIDHENRIAALENAAAAEYIYSFNNYGTRTTVLTEPYWDPEQHVVISDYEMHTVVFSINTNCPFNVSFEFEDQSNVTPQITLQNVRLGNGAPIDASALQGHTFASTNSNESTLSFTFRCNNYTSSTDENYTLTNVTLKVSSINDSSIYKIGSHIFKRWNEAKYVENDPEPIYTSEKTVDISYTYYGPFLQYWTNGTAQDAVKTVLDKLTTGDADEINNALSRVQTETNNLRTSQQTSSGTLNKNSVNGSVLSTGYCDGFGTYALMGAYTGGRSSYSFMFSTVKLVKEVNTTTITHYINGEVVPHMITNPENVEEQIVNPNWETDWEDSPEPVTTYYLGYMSSAVRTATSHLQYDSDLTLSAPVMYSRDMNYSGFNENWTQDTDNSGWLSVDVSTLASNTGNYNVIRLSSVTPLIDNDRRATLSINLPQNEQDVEHHNTLFKNVNEDTNINNIASAFGAYKSLTFSLIEDIYEHQPGVNVIMECLNDASNPLRVNVTRTANSIVTENEWGVIVKFYYLKNNGTYGITAGETAQTVQDRGTNSSSSTNVKLSSTSIKTGNQEDLKATSAQQQNNDTVAPISLMIRIPKTQLSCTWNISDYDDGRNNLIPQSVINILGGTPPNDVSSISIYSVTPFGFNYAGEDGKEDSSLRTATNETIKSNKLSSAAGENGMNLTYSVSGAWPTSAASPNTQMTFANSSVTAVTVHAWDNTQMLIDFTLRPGDLTEIPVDAQILGFDNPNILFYLDNEAYDYHYFYGNCAICEIPNWTTTGCTIKLRLYGSPTMAFEHNDRGASNSNDRGASNNMSGHNSTTRLESISAFKVYFKLYSQKNNYTCIMNYATSANNELSSKINCGAQYNIGISKSISIPNALYNANPGIIVNKEQEQQSSVSQMAEMLERLQNEVNSLKGEQQQTTQNTNTNR